MRIEIRSIDVLATIDGVPCRVWEGTTDRGTSCVVYVHRIEVDRDDDASEFERELREELPPAFDVTLWVKP